MADTERVVRRREVADMYGVADASVDRMEKRGEIPHRRRLSGGRVGWLLSELVEHMRRLPKEKLTERTAAARKPAARKKAAATRREKAEAAAGTT